MKTVSEISVVTNPSPGHGLFASLREKLASRPDTEHQAALIRIIIALVASIYVVVAVRMDGIVSASEWYVVKLIPIFLLFSVGIFVIILIYPQSSVPRRILSMVADLSATTYILYFLGDSGTPVYGMYLFNAAGNGFRFGPRYLYLSSSLGAAGFMFVLSTNEYWATHRTIGSGLMIVLVVIPMYFASLVRQLHAALERMRTMANHDTLTSLPNRYSFYEQLKHTLRHAEQNSVPFAVVFIDLDDFKPINDALGHAAGDMVLRSVARRLEESVRKSDIVARFGGDEFVIILTDIHKSTAPAIARKIIQTVAKPLEFDGKMVALSFSVGIATFPDNGRSLDELVACADAAMYRAKRTDRNCFCLDGELQIVSSFATHVHERKAATT